MHATDRKLINWVIGSRLFALAMLVLLVLAYVWLVAIAPAHAQGAAAAAPDARTALAAPVAQAQRSMAEAIGTASVAAQGALLQALPLAAPAAPPVQRQGVSPAGIDLIVRFEISSPAYYAQRLQRPVWPQGASGVTWGIGYDGGHQTAPGIAADWAAHPQVQRLATTAGVIGAPAAALAAQLRDVLTPLPLAQQVFADSTLPRYAELSAQAFRAGWGCLPADAQGSLTATVYNRGTSMRGQSRAEMRQLRDDCVPRCDTRCMAAAYRAMPRLWAGTPLEAGLTRRYEATARLAEGGA